jgi:hypothetical protein
MQVPAAAPKITILAWGSLIWDPDDAFDKQHDEWLCDGPTLKLEFSRVSDKRLGALTLVIDAEHGQDCRVAYTFSKRTDPEDAICDLRTREGTVRSRIGYVFLDGSNRNCRDTASGETIVQWAKDRKFDVVVWTDLESNFTQEGRNPFDVERAVAHLRSLSPAAKAQATEYVWRAPQFVATPLRSKLEQHVRDRIINRFRERLRLHQLELVLDADQVEQCVKSVEVYQGSGGIAARLVGGCIGPPLLDKIGAECDAAVAEVVSSGLVDS